MAWCLFALFTKKAYQIAVGVTFGIDFLTQLIIWLKVNVADGSKPGFKDDASDVLVLVLLRMSLLPLLAFSAKKLWRRYAKQARNARNEYSQPDRLDSPLNPTSITDRKKEYIRLMKVANFRREVTMSVLFALYTAEAIYLGVKTVRFTYTLAYLQAFLGLGAFMSFLEYFILRNMVELATKEEGENIPSLHMHPLFYDIGLECHGCDICHEAMKKPHYDAYRCRTCDFDLCPRCYKQKDNPEFKGSGLRRDGEAITTMQYFKRLLGLVSNFWPTLVGTGIALIVYQAMLVAAPNVQGHIFDSIYRYFKDDESKREENLQRFKNVIITYIIINVVTGLARAIDSLGINLMMTKLQNSVRQKLFDALIRLDIGFYDAMHTGQLSSRMNNDCYAMVEPLQMLLDSLISNVLQLVGCGFMAFFTSWKLAILAVTVVPPISYVFRQYARWGRKINRSIWQAYGECNKVSNEALQNIRTVRAFAAEEVERENFAHGIGVTVRYGVKSACVGATVAGFSTYMNLITSTLILWYGGHLVMVEQTITVGNLVTFQLYWNMLNSAFQGLGNVFNELIRSSSAAERVFAVMDARPEMPPDEGIPVTEFNGSIKVENIKFTYATRPGKQVLSGLSLELMPKTVTALVGKSGGGKSTLVHLMLRYYDPTHGRILVDGKDLKILKAQDVRKFIGFVGQETQLFAKSILENLTYGLTDVTMDEVIVATKMANAHDFILEMEEGYETRCGERGIQLSGGQKQRIALARCFLRKPGLMLLDEATSALDAENEALVQEGIDKLLDSMSCTVCLIAHRLSTVMNAFQIAVIHGGKVAEIGNHKALVEKKGIYANLVSRQMKKEQNVIPEHLPPTGAGLPHTPKKRGSKASGGQSPTRGSKASGGQPPDEESAPAAGAGAAGKTEIDALFEEMDESSPSKPESSEDEKTDNNNQDLDAKKGKK